jgi:Mg-chelatase subunit ChlD
MSWPTFEDPWWLLLLIPVAAITLLLVRRGTPTVPARQHRWAVAARLATLTLVVLAAAQPTFALEVPERTVLFVLDRSASIPAAARSAQEGSVAEALDASRPGDVTGVAVFGEELKIDAALAQDRRPEPVRTTVKDAATDLAAALRSAAVLLPTEGSRRIVLFTDGVETEGDGRSAAADLAEQGIAVDVVRQTTGRGPDAVAEGVRVPSTARVGENILATVVVRANSAGPAQLLVQAGAGDIDVLEVTLQPGLNEFTVEYPAVESGFLRIGARIDAAFDSRVENDVAEGLVRVLGPAQIAVVEGKTGDAEEVLQGLRAGGLEADLLSAIPSDNALLSYDAVVLVNVPAPPAAETERLAAYVEDLGRGLVVVGGDRSFGLGRYENTALEELLPVNSNPDDLVRRQKVAEVLVIDTSGSMGACHARGDSFIEGGINKTDISRAGAAAAIEALTGQDRVGVLAFSSGFDWAIPLGPKPDAASAEAALGTLTPQGDTEIATGLREALAQLRGAEEELRHIVLFTDGWDPNEANLLPVAGEIADSGITLSVVGTGEGAGTTLQRMAQLGGGRYYEGRDLGAIPEIFVEETLTVARSLAQEGSFLPMLGDRSQVTADLEATPPLYGYVLTRPKTTAQLPLLIGEEDPLLATWQRGLGRVSVWTSDATARWSADWLPWEGYVDFWGKVVGDVLPAGRETPPDVEVSGGLLTITYDAGDVPLDAAAVATVRSPDGDVEVVPLNRTSVTEFRGQVRVSDSGAYWVAVAVEDSGATVASGSSGAVSSYAEEFAFRDPDGGLLADIASLPGGRLDPDMGSVFDPAPVTGKARRVVWPWLAAAALAFFMADVTLRRLVLAGAVTSRSAQRAGEEPIDDELPEPPEPIAERETVGRLLQRKQK